MKIGVVHPIIALIFHYRPFSENEILTPLGGVRGDNQ